MADYPNRSDLRNPATRKVAFTGQTYGEASAQAASQAAVSPGSAPAQVQAQQAATQANRPRPGSMPLTRPSERPNEPITAGAPFGPGPGPASAGVIGKMVQVDSVLETLKALYLMYPNDGLEALIAQYNARENK